MKSSLLYRYALVFVAILASVSVWAAEPTAEYSLREWHGEDGLLNEAVQCVAQDRQGYLWVVAVGGGVARFDGVRFDVPQPMVAVAPALAVHSLVMHPDFGLLFSTNSGEIWQWDDNTLRKSPPTDLFSKQPIEAWFVQADGTLWAIFSDGKIEYLRRGRVTELKLDGAKSVRHFISFASDGGDDVLIAVDTSLFRFSNGQVTKITTPWSETELRLVPSRQGKPWIITRDSVGRWNGRGLESVVLIPERLGPHYVRTAMEDREGKLWVGTRSQGAYLVTDHQYQNVPASHRTIASLCQDREGNVWMATVGGGLDRLQAKHFRLFDSKSGLRDDLTLSVCEDVSGQIWFANGDGGVARATKAGVEVMSGRQDWPDVNPGRIVADVAGGVWFSTRFGLFKSDTADRIVKIDTETFPTIRGMFVSRAGELWLAGVMGEFGRLARTGFTAFGAADGFPSDQAVNCISEDAQGFILVGTTGGSILRFDGTRFESLRSAGAAPLASVRAVFAEKDGAVWVATAAGLVLIRGGRDHFLTSAHGLPNGQISQMLFDDFGAVWFGSPYGIYRVERREIMEFLAGRIGSVHATTFGKNEGFARISCVDGYYPNSVKGRDGILWFTTRLGVLAINPTGVRDSGNPPIFIDELRVDEKVQPLSAAVYLRSDTHKLEIRFSVLNFTAPERTPVRYRLDGFDQEWIDAGFERKIVYPRLLPGNYSLRIVSANDEKGWSESGAVLQIVVVPYWWQKHGVQLGFVAVVIAVLIVVVRAWSHRRLRSKLERMKRESAVDRERTRIARDIHDELGASLTRISLLTQSTPPDIASESTRACFNEIYATTTEITRSIDEIVWAVDARHDNLESMVSYFDSYAQGFLSVAKIRYRLDAPCDVPELLVSSSSRHHLFLAFKEALHNCVKHAKATEVTVRIEHSADRLSLVVSDNGYGMSSSLVPRAGGGNGLPNLAMRMSAIGGDCNLRDNKNGGAEVVLTIPLAKLNQ